MALTSTLIDDFQWGNVDTVKWTTSGDASQVFETTTNAADQNIYLKITHTAISQYNTLIAVATYDLTNDNSYVNLTDAGNQSLASHEAIFGMQKDASNLIWFTISAGNISAFKKVVGVQAQVGSSLTYSASTHAWLRIRDDGTTMYWDTSVDGTNWTNRWSVLNLFAVTALSPFLQSGCYSNEASASYAIFDNFNCLATTLQFSWMGYTWNKRVQTGPSMYNSNWASANVTGPDANNYMTLSMSNPGSAPVGAEIYSAVRGWGYGTYICTIATRGDNIHHAIVLGGMFTFDYTRSPDYAEIDMGEVRLYNSNPNIRILYSHVWNNGGSGTFITDDSDVTADVVRTYKCVWTPTQLIYTSFVGGDQSGTILEHVIHDSHIPSTSLERIHFNIWVSNNDTPAGATATDLIIRQFIYEPLKKPGNVRRFITVGNGVSRNEGAT